MMLYFQAHIWVICVDGTNTESFLQWGLIALMVSWKHNVLWGYSLQAHVKEMLCSLCQSKSSAAAVCSSCRFEAYVTPQHMYLGLSSPTSPNWLWTFTRSAWFGTDLIEAKTYLLGGLTHQIFTVPMCVFFKGNFVLLYNYFKLRASFWVWLRVDLLPLVGRSMSTS